MRTFTNKLLLVALALASAFGTAACADDGARTLTLHAPDGAPQAVQAQIDYVDDQTAKVHLGEGCTLVATQRTVSTCEPVDVSTIVFAASGVGVAGGRGCTQRGTGRVWGGSPIGTCDVDLGAAQGPTALDDVRLVGLEPLTIHAYVSTEERRTAIALTEE